MRGAEEEKEEGTYCSIRAMELQQDGPRCVVALRRLVAWLRHCVA